MDIINILFMIIGYSVVIVLIFMYIAFRVIAHKYKETNDEKAQREWLKNHQKDISFYDFMAGYKPCRSCGNYYSIQNGSGHGQDCPEIYESYECKTTT